MTSFQKPKPLIFSVDGNIGSGKSTLVSNIQSKFGTQICLLKEPVNEWEEIKERDCIYPCNPFIQIKDMKESLKILKKDEKKFIFPVTNYTHPIERAYILKNQNELKFSNNFFSKSRTQDLKTKYYDTGQFYFASKKTWLKSRVTKKLAIKIPNWRVIDIDNEIDWNRAEIMYRFIQNNKKSIKKFL